MAGVGGAFIHVPPHLGGSVGFLSLLFLCPLKGDAGGDALDPNLPHTGGLPKVPNAEGHGPPCFAPALKQRCLGSGRHGCLAEEGLTSDLLNTLLR